MGDVQPSVGAQTMTGTSLSCTGTINGSEVNCGSAATLTRVNCSDGYAFIITGGSETLYVRMQGGSQWSSGAQFKGGLALNGDITFANLLPPSMLPPPAGTQEQASFVLQDTTSGQGVVANGTLQASW